MRQTVRSRPGREPAPRARRSPRPGRPCATIHGMFAQTVQNWWWPAHPAAR
ncbi:trp operon leader peptide [Streptomyces finlayi]|uniref:Trp operon leader peptide n=1 Tax=Streptomyces finlayi TaxID=67296 RepID=A0A7G7BRC5_9ACTN|nr:trp operon leader peptide [Streptomyces finlayi]